MSVPAIKIDDAVKAMKSALMECEAYFDQRADADCDQDGFIPNEEMKLLSEVREALSKLIITRSPPYVQHVVGACAEFTADDRLMTDSKVVPLEPTEAMLERGAASACSLTVHGARGVYLSMLDASPALAGTISADPDLLAALKGLLDEVDASDVRLSSPVYEAQKAIAKAEPK